MELQIRLSDRGDFPFIQAIERKAFPDPWPEEAFTDFLFPWAFSLFAGEELVGYIFYQGVEDEMVIINFAIDPGHQGRGLGDYLLENSMQEMYAHGVRHIYLDVRNSNVKARNLYHKHGFEEIGLRKKYYSHPEEDAIVMVKHSL